MLSTIATLLSILNGAWTALKNLFGWGKTKPDENTQAVETANESGKLSADEARATREATTKELDENATQTSADVTTVRDASSLREGADDINSAIARANTHPDSNS